MSSSLAARRREAERRRIEAYESSLRRVSQLSRQAPDFERAIAEASAGFTGRVVRDPGAWRPNMKTRDAARLRLAAARHLFARYPAPRHLEHIWLDQDGLEVREVKLRKRWYVVAAGGGSLYREGAGAWLSRKEVHAFLNPPVRLGFDAAIWYAIARSCSDDIAVALRIARGKISLTPRAELAFWREAVRFLCAHPRTLQDIDALGDYLAHCRRHNPGYSLKGRTPASLRRQMRERDLEVAAIARIEAARRCARRQAAREARWPGAKIADWSWSRAASDPAEREEYVLIQLRTARDLVAESRVMRHCVMDYAPDCIAGTASIFSLRRHADGMMKRLLTIEVDSRFRVIQIRGFANRRPLPEELKLLERWGRARDLEMP